LVANSIHPVEAAALKVKLGASGKRVRKGLTAVGPEIKYARDARFSASQNRLAPATDLGCLRARLDFSAEFMWQADFGDAFGCSAQG
jgi:hypothetical protein